MTTDRIVKAVRCYTGMMTQHGLVSLDYADIRAFTLDCMRGRAAHGEGEASGEDRAMKAVERALEDLKRNMRY